MEDLIKAIDDMLNDELIKIVISNKINKENKYNKISIFLKENKKKEYYQIEKYTDKQVFHENIEKEELRDKILEFVYNNYKQLNGWSEKTTFDMKILNCQTKVIIKKRIIYLKKVQ